MAKASRTKRDRNEVRQSAAHTLRIRSEARGIPPGHFKEGPEARGAADALNELIDPYLSDELTLEQRSRVVTLGVLAWNSALLPEGVWQELVREAVESVPEDLRPHLVKAVEDLRRRKLQLFPQDRRQIVDRELRLQKDGSFYLMVAVQVNKAS
jgi:hypothetical protein